NLLLATSLSANCPVMSAPAMDFDLWLHPITQEHIKLLQSSATILIALGTVEWASGLIARGRRAEQAERQQQTQAFFNGALPLVGKRALVSAGPTYEAIDPVRFIGNHSSGKMGYAIAAALQSLGATVTLVSGPTALPTPLHVVRHDVTSAQEMLEACSA